MIRTHQNKIAVAVKRDIRTVARYKDTIREWSSAKCGTARRQQTRSATAAGSPSKHSGNPRSRFFFGFVGYLFFFLGFAAWYLADTQQNSNKVTPLRNHSKESAAKFAHLRQVAAVFVRYKIYI